MAEVQLRVMVRLSRAELGENVNVRASGSLQGGRKNEVKGVGGFVASKVQ